MYAELVKWLPIFMIFTFCLGVVSVYLIVREVKRVINAVDRIPDATWLAQVTSSMNRIPDRTWFSDVKDSLKLLDRVDGRIDALESRIHTLEGR